MNWKIFKPSAKKIGFFIGALIVEFFILPIKAILIYSPEIGAEYIPLTTICSTFQAITPDYSLGSCKFAPISWAYIIPAIIITYILVSLIISKIESKKNQ